MGIPLLRGRTFDAHDDGTASVDPQQPVGPIRPMETLIAQSGAPQRLNYLLLGAFAVVAVVLTAAGLYGVMA